MDSTRFSDDPASQFRDPRPLGDLVRELGGDAKRLVQQELVLARTELRETMRQVAADAGRAAAGGGVAAVGGLVLVAFLVILLGQLLGEVYWLSALLVGLALVAGGGWIGYRSWKNLQGDSLAPAATIDSLRRTRGWAGAEAVEFRHTLVNGRQGPGNGQQVVIPRSSGSGAPAPRLPPGAPVAPAAESQPVEHTLTARPDSPTRWDSAARADDRPTAAGGLLKRLWHEFNEDQVTAQAARVAYYAFLALPPAFMVLFGLTGFFGGPAAADAITLRLEGMLPDAASALIDDFVQQIVHDQAPGPLSFGLVLALWAASGVFVALNDALNTAYDVEETRSWIKRRALAVGVMLVTAVLVLAGSTALLAGPAIAGALDLFGTADLLWTILQWPLALLLIAAAFWIIYRVFPAKDQSGEARSIVKGAVAAAVLWVLATAAFRVYVANFSSYSETYGFLGAVIVLLLWLYITGIVVLLGGELNAELQEQPSA